MDGKRRKGRPAVSSIGVLRQAAGRFSPPYRLDAEADRALTITLKDPSGNRPDLTLRHRQERRLFLKANYLVAESAVAGEGPPEDGELAFRFRGPFSRQRASIRWRRPVTEGEEWLARLEEALLRGVSKVEAVQSFRIRWTAATHVWHLRLETMSGSMVGGFMAALPIAVPLDKEEADGIIDCIDALAATRG